MTVTQDLVELTRKATGPDRALSATIHHAVLGSETPYFDTLHSTASIDAALALAERVLPGWRYDLHSPRMGQVFEAVLLDGDSASRRIVVAHAASAPLAIVLAILLALQSSEPTND